MSEHGRYLNCTGQYRLDYHQQAWRYVKVQMAPSSRCRRCRRSSFALCQEHTRSSCSRLPSSVSTLQCSLKKGKKRTLCCVAPLTVCFIFLRGFWSLVLRQRLL